MVKVLFVDDSDLMLKIAKTMLEKFGNQVLTATNGKEAIELAEKERPEVIFLDAEMPEMDGWETCKVIKNTSTIKDIPIIMCTGHESEEYRQKSTEFGASGYVTKPYNFELINKTISELLKQKR